MTVETVARRSYGKLVAFLSARTQDVSSAEDALSEAFATALLRWPLDGCPARPEAWLLTVARRKLIDRFRQQRRTDSLSSETGLVNEALGPESGETDIPDQRLALMFACAHPAIDVTIRAPLILQAVLGLDAARIASAFLMSPATMSQRLVRAKNKIRQAGVPFRIPDRDELSGRLSSVLDAIYAAFAEGWTDAAGTDLARRDLADEAIYLGRLVSELLPHEPESLGLLALMLHAEARRAARRSAAGEYVPFENQDPVLWNSHMIEESELLLLRASSLGAIGRYQLEAALQSAHGYRKRTGRANWAAVVELYDALLALSRSPVVAINRAIALAELRGPTSGLEALQELAEDPRLNQYQAYWAARAELLVRSGAAAEATLAYDIAIGLEADPAVRVFLQQRRASSRD